MLRGEHTEPTTGPLAPSGNRCLAKALSPRQAAASRFRRVLGESIRVEPGPVPTLPLRWLPHQPWARELVPPNIVGAAANMNILGVDRLMGVTQPEGMGIHSGDADHSIKMEPHSTSIRQFLVVF